MSRTDTARKGKARSRATWLFVAGRVLCIRLAQLPRGRGVAFYPGGIPGFSTLELVIPAGCSARKALPLVAEAISRHWANVAPFSVRTTRAALKGGARADLQSREIVVSVRHGLLKAAHCLASEIEETLLSGSGRATAA